MSSETLQKAFQDLQKLSDSDQKVVLDLVRVLSHRNEPNLANPAPFTNPELRMKDGLLVFSGEIEGDVLEAIREDRIDRENSILGRSHQQQG